MLSARRNAAWRQRRQVLQEAIPDSFWTALDRYDNGTWTAYTPGFAYEVAAREGTQRAAFAEAERRIARIIRSMYEVGHRLPAASPSLEAAQQEEARNRQAYEALEERVRVADASTSEAQTGPKVIERQWLRVHVDLSLADSLDNNDNPLVRRAVEPFVVTYTGEEEEDEDDSDSDEELATEMAVDDDTPWVEPPLMDDAYGEPSTSARGAEIDSLLPFRAMLESRAQLVAQRVREARAAGGNAAADEDGLITRTEAEGLRSISWQNGPGRPYHPRAPRRSVYSPPVAPVVTGMPRVRHAPDLPPAAQVAAWKQGEASLR